jgi:ATP-dependent HslUV protease subunit HslV
MRQADRFHGTTIVAVRRDGRVALGGDGQVTVGDTVVKASAQKVRKLKDGRILAGFAGSVADACAVREVRETERYSGNPPRAAVEPPATGGRTASSPARGPAGVATAVTSLSAVTATSSSLMTTSSRSEAVAPCACRGLSPAGTNRADVVILFAHRAEIAGDIRICTNATSRAEPA